MAKKTKKENERRIISIQRLSEAAGVDYMKLYYYLRSGSVKTTAKYKDFSSNESTKICNALNDELAPIFDKLGFQISIRRKD